MTSRIAQGLLVVVNALVCVGVGVGITQADGTVPFLVALVVGLAVLALWLWMVFMPLWARARR